MIRRWAAWLSVLSSEVSAAVATAGPLGDADVSLIPAASH